ncbi:DUF1513 domain-containing protein [Marinomonas piezotolerans]|uniref:DUF1513 domain-containing protein n=1 Tax=Marinomonas piezotolerans TaxID=2213058 RepID=A0A370UD09_9GAMM|nr:DUF1513 domain-containing protein [Marinomonas piezotolerans]RDL45672.1 DUF1513 domain-containing protein [Marinomonas piezotolerans]
MLSRRSFLTSSLAVLALPTWASLIPSGGENVLYFSAFTKGHNEHFFGAFAKDGHIVWSMPLPERAHAPVIHPSHRAVGIVARRPGYYMNFFDPISGQQLLRISPLAEHHFYGHAVFSHDGKRLITQENHYPSGAGKITIRDWPSGKVVNEFDSGGIGPHESVVDSQGTLIVANGGLRTHPDNDREILNLTSMTPNVTYLSLSDGAIRNRIYHEPDLHQLSVRHLDVNAQGITALGFQHQGNMWDNVPLVALTTQDSTAFEYLTMPEQVRMRFKQYCGSVCFDASGNTLAVSTPRGGMVAYWDVPSREFLGVNHCRDVCGLAATGTPNEFILTSGTGKQLVSSTQNHIMATVNQVPAIKWDNHLRRMEFIV